jgi:hypothetical protein
MLRSRINQMLQGLMGRRKRKDKGGNHLSDGISANAFPAATPLNSHPQKYHNKGRKGTAENLYE